MQLVRDNFDFERYLSEAVDSERVSLPSTYLDDVFDRFYGAKFTDAPTMPWLKTHEGFRFREGETTLWAGVNSHGKTLITGQVALSLMQQGHKVAIASFEMPPAASLARLARMAAGGPLPSKEYINEFLHWCDGKLILFDHEGTCHQKRLLGVMRYVAKDLGARHFFIDNLTKIAVEDDYKGQQLFIDQITAVGRDTKMHCNVIAHVRKGQSEYDVPDKFDIKGSGAIADQIDNAFIVWRNKRKEDRMKVPVLPPEEKAKLQQQPDCLLILNKQRHFEYEGKFSLWIHHPSMSFLESMNDHHNPLALNIGPQERTVVFEW